MKTKEIWINPDRKHGYFQTSNKGFFCLCQVGGSLSSLITYKNKEEAISDGWRLK